MISYPKVLVVAGEESGDLYGAELIRRVRELWPGLTFFGIGGRRMRAAGLECLFPAEPLAVVGLPSWSQLKLLRQAWNRLKEFLIQQRPLVTVLIDFPGFNLRLAKLAHRHRVPVFYYIAPQVWAWNRRRVKILRRFVDLLVVILPFEKVFFEKEGLKGVEFVGHPLWDLVKPALSRQTFCEIAGLSPHRPILGLFPGSRENEVKRLLPIFLETYELLCQDYPYLQGVLVKASGLSDGPWWEKARRQVKVLEGYVHEVLKQASAALLASGTITLEAALLETPMVAAYKLPAFSFFLARKLVKVPYITLPNLILDEPVVPEFLQEAVTPTQLAQALRPLLFDSSQREKFQAKLRKVKALLGGPGASWRVAELLTRFIRSTLQSSPPLPSASEGHAPPRLSRTE